MKKKRLRILITDDHATTRLGIKHILEEAFKGLASDEAANAAETLRKLDEGRWDLLILDISLPDRDGLSVLRHLRQTRPARNSSSMPSAISW
ncbi:MAG: response regulator [Verrucomicrobia bacterium]|nr:response regulator [Verrucomicrobiota bacterium]